MGNGQIGPMSWKEWWKDLIKTLIWAGVTLYGLWKVGKPLAEGMSYWMTKASPDKLLEALFSFPMVLFVIFLFVGIKRLRFLVDTIINAIAEGRLKAFPGFEFHPKGVRAPTLGPTPTEVPTQSTASAEPIQDPTKEDT